MRFQSGMLWVLQNLGILPSGWWGSPSWKFTITRILSWELQHDTVRGCSLRIGVGHLISWIGSLIWGFRIDLEIHNTIKHPHICRPTRSCQHVVIFVGAAFQNSRPAFRTQWMRWSIWLRVWCWSYPLRNNFGGVAAACTAQRHILSWVLCFATQLLIGCHFLICFFLFIRFNSSSMYNICGIWHCLNWFVVFLGWSAELYQKVARSIPIFQRVTGPSQGHPILT